VVVGNVDYSEFKQTLERIDRILLDSGAETQFIQWYVEQCEAEEEAYARRMGKPPRKLSNKERANVQTQALRALRCNVVRELTGGSARGLSTRLADSPLLQWFCGISRVDVVRVPSKSTLDRYEKLVPEATVRKVVDLLNGVAASTVEDGQGRLGLEQPLDIEAMFLDTSCVRANIHFPVDWVLLRDAVRTLIKAVMVIRVHGLKNRMGEPSEFIRGINRLSIEMTHTRRRPDSRKARKRVLRLMKKLLKKVDRHAQKHRDFLETERQRTDLTEPESAAVINRIDRIREQLPAAIRQAHERIIGERLVPNSEKILSLYEPDIHVLVRGKAGAEVEFGNTLLLAEQPQGVIVDWKLVKDQAPADSKMVADSLDRFESVFGALPPAMVGDRGFDSKNNRRDLEEAGVFNAICPRSVAELRKRMKEDAFVRLQRRRAQTESRIAIFKNGFLGRPMRSKGFTYRETHVAWAVLAHNLWVLARLPMAEEAAQAVKRAA
jgi:IS5 family transposase